MLHSCWILGYKSITNFIHWPIKHVETLLGVVWQNPMVFEIFWCQQTIFTITNSIFCSLLVHLFIVTVRRMQMILLSPYIYISFIQQVEKFKFLSSPYLTSKLCRSISPEVPHSNCLCYNLLVLLKGTNFLILDSVSLVMIPTLLPSHDNMPLRKPFNARLISFFCNSPSSNFSVAL